MKKNGFGAIDILIGLVITAFIFIIGMSSLKGISTIKLNGSKTTPQSVQEQVDKQVNEIEQMRQQTIDYNNNASQNY